MGELIELFDVYLQLPRFGLVAARVAGMLMFIPVFAAMSVPVNVRIVLVIGLSVLVAPLAPLAADPPDTALGLTLALAHELLLGVLMGVIAAACFAGAQVAAMLVAQETGLAFAQIVDPSSEEQETVLGVFYLQLTIVVYLVVGGHRALLAACLDTFSAFPLLAEFDVANHGVTLATKACQAGFVLALQIAAPALLTMMLVNVALGFVSRTMPQLNILAVGFSIKPMVAFLVLAASLPVAADMFIRALQQTCAWVTEVAAP